MPYKVYIKNNYIYFEDSANDIQIFGHTKDVKIYPQTLTSDIFNIENTNSDDSFQFGVDYSVLTDSGDAAFTRQGWIDFYTLETGKYSPDGGANHGFIDYNDTSTTTTPIVLVADTWTELPNDGLGSSTNKNFLPDGVTELMTTPSGQLDTSELTLGDSILVRNDYTVNPNTNNSLLKFRYSLGTGGSAYTLEKIVGRLDAGSGVDYRRALVTDLIYMGDNNTKENPIKLEINLSTTGTLINAGTVIQVLKF